MFDFVVTMQCWKYLKTIQTHYLYKHIQKYIMYT